MRPRPYKGPFLADLILTSRHLVALVLDSDRENPLFRAPVRDPQHILDLGTGKGIWAMYVHGLDLLDSIDA